MKAVCTDDLESLISQDVLNDKSPNAPVNWKEALAYIYAYEGDVEDRNDMIRDLADKLVAMREITPAIVCYIMSESVVETLDLWKRRALHNINSREQTRERALFDLFTKFVFFKLALEQSDMSGEVERQRDFDLILTEIGRYMTSDEQAALTFMKYLNMASEPSQDLACLKERLYKAHESAMCGRVQLPPSPYSVVRAKP